MGQAVQGCDAGVLMLVHDSYCAADLGGLQTQVARPILIDGRHAFSAEQPQTAGWDYRAVGRGQQ